MCIRAILGQLMHDSQHHRYILVACDCVNMPEDAGDIKQSDAYEVFESHSSYLVLEAFSKVHPLK